MKNTLKQALSKAQAAKSTNNSTQKRFVTFQKPQSITDKTLEMCSLFLGTGFFFHTCTMISNTSNDIGSFQKRENRSMSYVGITDMNKLYCNVLMSAGGVTQWQSACFGLEHQHKNTNNNSSYQYCFIHKFMFTSYRQL